MDNLLNIKLPEKSIRTVTITDIDSVTIKMSDGNSKSKIILKVKELGKNTIFDITNSWINVNGKAITRGLWIRLDPKNPETLLQSCTLSRVMKQLKIKSFKEFVGKEVQVYPDEKDYLSLVSDSEVANLLTY